LIITTIIEKAMHSVFKFQV